MAKPEKEKAFYVGVKEPIDLRKNLLECSKIVVKSLQKYEKFKDIRKKKIENIINLKGIIKEIKKLNNNLISKLPETKIKAERKERKIVPKGKKEVEGEISKTEIKKTNELEKLEAELSSIESKLDTLSS
jgi:DNA replicative helicase MCM subunit Mcm2 (Cdc46/Mcm family)